MKDSISKILKKVKISNYIYGIFILFSIIGFYANSNQIKYVHTSNKKYLKKAHTSRMIILTIALIIYIYYLENTVKSKTNDKNKLFFENLNIFAAILFLIGGIITLYLEYKGDEEIILTE